MGKHLEQALPSVYTLQCLTGKVDNNINLPISQTLVNWKLVMKILVMLT